MPKAESFSETPYAVDGNTLWTTVGHDLVEMDIERGREVDRFRLDDLLGGEAVAQGVAIGDGSAVGAVAPSAGGRSRGWIPTGT